MVCSVHSLIMSGNNPLSWGHWDTPSLEGFGIRLPPNFRLSSEVLVTRYHSSTSNVRRVIVSSTWAPRITQPGLLNLSHSLEDIIRLCIGTFMVIGNDVDRPSWWLVMIDIALLLLLLVHVVWSICSLLFSSHSEVFLFSAYLLLGPVVLYFDFLFVVVGTLTSLLWLVLFTPIDLYFRHLWTLIKFISFIRFKYKIETTANSDEIWKDSRNDLRTPK